MTGRLQVLGIALILSLPAGAAGSEQQLVAGAGPSTKIVSLFFELFSDTFAASGYAFTIPPRSAKHAGGIQASEKYLFGRTGRPLSEAEEARNKKQIFLARIPIAFVTGPDTGVTQVTLDQLRRLFTGRISDWSELGGASAPVELVGREKTEALFSILRTAYPFFETVRFERVFTRDHQVVNYLKAPTGKYALAFGALPNLEGLNVLEVDGFEAGVSVGLVYDGRNRSHPLVDTVQHLSRSTEWQAAILEAGYLPPS